MLSYENRMTDIDMCRSGAWIWMHKFIRYIIGQI